MPIQVANTLDEAVTRKRIIYQSEALFSHSSHLARVQSVNYGFTVPRTDVNQYGQLGQIERIITEVPTVNLDFTYHLHGTVNETILLGNGANGSSFGFMRDLNNSGTPQYSQDFSIGLSKEGIDFADGNTQNNDGRKGILVPNSFLTAYSWTGAVGDVPSATVNAESTEFKIADVAQAGVTPVSGNKPVVLRPGNVGFSSANSGDPGETADLPVLGFDVLHVQSFTVSVDIPRESIQRLGSQFEFARVITFPIQATMSVEGIISTQAASDLTDIVGTGAANQAASDPGYSIDVHCHKAPGTGENASAVAGIALMMRNAKIEGHSISSSIGANKSVTLDYSVQIDGGGNAVSSAGVAGFFLDTLA